MRYYKQPTCPVAVTTGKLAVCCTQLMLENEPVMLVPLMVTTTVPPVEYQVVFIGWLGGFVMLNTALPGPNRAFELTSV